MVGFFIKSRFIIFECFFLFCDRSDKVKYCGASAIVRTEWCFCVGYYTFTAAAPTDDGITVWTR